MKTSEVIDILSQQNNECVFVNEEGNAIRRFFSNIVWQEHDITVELTKNFLKHTWELVPTEVTWQEAIQAWVDGEKVHYVKNYTKVYLDDIYYLQTIDARPISKVEISRCKWFIG